MRRDAVRNCGTAARRDPLVRTTHRFRSSFLWKCAFVLAAALGTGRHAGAEDEVKPADPYRQAILIGEWKYTPPRDDTSTDQVLHTLVPPLDDMSTDLKLLGDALTERGFVNIVPLQNPDSTAIWDALKRAKAEATDQRSKSSVLTVVYFGGHGTMVGNTSYVLASEYVPPPDDSLVGQAGAIQVDAIGQFLSSSGDPALLIVDTCRNAFTPNPAAAIPTHPMPPFAYFNPGLIGRFAVAYSQKAGWLVQYDNAGPTLPTLYVGEILRILPRETGAFELFADAAWRANRATQDKPFPLNSQYVFGAIGDLRLWYNDGARAYDQYNWEQNKDRIDELEDFLIRYPTSRYAALARASIARQKIAQDAQSAKTAVFTQRDKTTREILGSRAIPATIGAILKGGVARVDTTAAIQVFDRSGSTFSISDSDVHAVRRVGANDAGGVVVEPHDELDQIVVTAIREEGGGGGGNTGADGGPPPRVEFQRHNWTRETKYDVRLKTGEVIRVAGATPSADPSKFPAFWEDEAVAPLTCTGDEIRGRECRLIEQIVDQSAKKDPQAVGTIFVASVLDGNRPGFGPADSDDLAHEIKSRFAAAGIVDQAVAFRLFFGSELKNAPTTVLLKRGDGRKFGTSSEVRK